MGTALVLYEAPPDLRGRTTISGWKLAWLDSAGRTKTAVETPLDYVGPTVSPDGKLIALSSVASSGDITVYDTERGTMTRVTTTGQGNRSPVWTPDGKHLVYASTTPQPAIWWIRADGAGQPQKLLEGKGSLQTQSFTPDGRRLLYDESSSDNNRGAFTLPLDISDPEHPKPGKPEVFLKITAAFPSGEFSPDGRWIAYESNESGQEEVYVRPFGPPGSGSGRVQISSGGGGFPTWSRSGREIFFESLDHRIMVAAYRIQGDTFAADEPQLWFNQSLLLYTNQRNYALAPDGKRLIIPEPKELDLQETGSLHVTVLINFFDELARRIK